MAQHARKRVDITYHFDGLGNDAILVSVTPGGCVGIQGTLPDGTEVLVWFDGQQWANEYAELAVKHPELFPKPASSRSVTDITDAELAGEVNRRQLLGKQFSIKFHAEP